MQLTIKKQVEETIDVDFPVYKRYAGFKKILSPEEFISVSDTGIEHDNYAPLRIATYITDGEEIEPTVFNNAFQDALSKYNQMLFMQASTPATDEDIRSKLYDEETIKHVNS